MITIVLFDMDGLLLDTEPLWGESMLKVAHQHGIRITREQFKETTGLKIHEVTAYWAVRYPWQGASSEKVAEDILDDIIALACAKGRIMPGVWHTLSLLDSHHIQKGVASSSPTRMIKTLLSHFNLDQCFDTIVSADVVPWGKPHPAVFLEAASQLEANPLECMVLEDSLNGMIAGKAARMKVVVVPDEKLYGHPGFSLADAQLKSLEDFHLDLLQ